MNDPRIPDASLYSDFTRDRSYVSCATRVDAISLEAATQELCARRDTGRAVHLCTTHTLALAARDAEFAAALNRSELNLPDGMPLVWIARRLGIEMERQVGGRNLMAATLDEGRAVGLRHYLYGSTPEVMGRLVDSIQRRWPGVMIVGAETPPFRPLTSHEKVDVAARIRQSGADVVWVGLGTPKQDTFVDEFSRLVPAAHVAVGAAFDFHAGTSPIAPAWMTSSGLEWLFRLWKEPRRLWRRYAVGHGLFIWHTIRYRPRPCAQGRAMPRHENEVDLPEGA